jgi:hypothetical protein
MLCHTVLVRIDVSEECSASIIRVTRIGELGTTLTVENAVFCDVTPCGSCKNRRFGGTQHFIIKVIRTGELGTALAVTSNRRSVREAVKNAVSWNLTPCGLYKSRRFGGTYRLHHQGDKNWQAAWLMEVIRSSETSVLNRPMWCNIPENGILHRLKVFENRVLRRIFGLKRD